MSQQTQTLDTNQLAFVLLSLGKYKFYSNGGHFPGESFEVSISKEFSRKFASVIGQLSILSGLGYNANWEMVLSNPLSVNEIQGLVGEVGMHIPAAYQISTQKAFEYIIKFGHLYKDFDGIQNLGSVYPPTGWMNLKNTLVSQPTVSGLDKFVSPHLKTHLRDLYTDFDLFNRFPDLNLNKYVDRPGMIQAVVNYYHPAGEFWFSFGFESIGLEHQFGNRTINYTTKDQIKSIGKGGRLLFGSSELDPVGFYQIALLVQPEYFFEIYGMEINSSLFSLLLDIFVHFLIQIRYFELSTETKYRFPSYPLLNHYLDQTGKTLEYTDRLEEIRRTLN